MNLFRLNLGFIHEYGMHIKVCTYKQALTIIIELLFTPNQTEKVFFSPSL